jgi:hypothetical protein
VLHGAALGIHETVAAWRVHPRAQSAAAPRAHRELRHIAVPEEIARSDHVFDARVAQAGIRCHGPFDASALARELLAVRKPAKRAGNASRRVRAEHVP